MSRYLRNVRKRKMRRTIYISIISFVFMIFLIFVVDYRLNNAVDSSGIKIISFKSEPKEFKIRLLEEHEFSINTTYLKNDIRKLSKKIKNIAKLINNTSMN